MLRRTLPIVNLIACALFVWIREPASSYFQEVDRARQQGSSISYDDIWGTLACRPLNNWGPTHGGEAIGVAALEVLNLPSLVLTGFVGVFAEVFSASTSSACRQSWLLAGVFMVFASAQWWYVGRAIDLRRGRINVKPIWLAYAVAPFGAVPVAAGLQVWYALVEREPLGGTSLWTAAVVGAYFFGLLLLPVWWIFKRIGWLGWRYYVPTGTCAGVLIAYVWAYGPAEDWMSCLLFGLAGMSCAIVFSIALAYGHRRSAIV